MTDTRIEISLPLGTVTRIKGQALDGSASKPIPPSDDAAVIKNSERDDAVVTKNSRRTERSRKYAEDKSQFRNFKDLNVLPEDDYGMIADAQTRTAAILLKKMDDSVPAGRVRLVNSRRKTNKRLAKYVEARAKMLEKLDARRFTVHNKYGFGGSSKYSGGGSTVHHLKLVGEYKKLDRLKKAYKRKRKLIRMPHDNAGLVALIKSRTQRTINTQLNGANGEVTGTDDFDMEIDEPKRRPDAAPQNTPIEKAMAFLRGQYQDGMLRMEADFEVVDRDVQEVLLEGPLKPVAGTGLFLVKEQNLKTERPEMHVEKSTVRHERATLEDKNTVKDIICWIIDNPDEFTDLEPEEWPFSLVEEVNNSLLIVKSALNGSHGEATETDDLKNRAKAVIKKIRNDPRTRDLLKTVGRHGAKSVIGAAAYRDVANALKKSRRRKKQVPRGMTKPGHQTLSVAASKMAIAIADPFSIYANGAYIPSASVLSQKVTAYSRGEFKCGGTGGGTVGYFAMSPCTANDQVAGVFTGEDFAGSNITTPSSTYGANGVFNAVISNLPYGRSQLINLTSGSLIEARIVSAGLRVSYIGTRLNEGGRTLSYFDSENSSVIGASYSSLGSKLTTSYSEPVIGRTSVANCFGFTADHNQFTTAQDTSTRVIWPLCESTTSNLHNDGTSNVGAPFSAVIVAPAVQTSVFFYELVTHVEYSGPGVAQSLLTDCEVDITGLNIVRTASMHAGLMMNKHINSNFKDCFMQALADQNVKMGRFH